MYRKSQEISMFEERLKPTHHLRSAAFRVTEMMLLNFGCFDMNIDPSLQGCTAPTLIG